ncbi:hypothetical protein E4T56_gene1007, partial [Termitomyces sp. T112]
MIPYIILPGALLSLTHFHSRSKASRRRLARLLAGLAWVEDLETVIVCWRAIGDGTWVRWAWLCSSERVRATLRGPRVGTVAMSRCTSYYLIIYLNGYFSCIIVTSVTPALLIAGGRLSPLLSSSPPLLSLLLSFSTLLCAAMASRRLDISSLLCNDQISDPVILAPHLKQPSQSSSSQFIRHASSSTTSPTFSASSQMLLPSRPSSSHSIPSRHRHSPSSNPYPLPSPPVPSSAHFVSPAKPQSFG